MEQWIQALNTATEILLGKRSLDPDENSKESETSTVDDETSKVVDKILTLNQHQCADCGKSGADWASINLGIVLCIECAGVHRRLGVQTSQVRSLRLDHDCWDEATVSVMLGISNERSNKVWCEKASEEERKRVLEDRENFIRMKYQMGKWVGDGENDEEEEEDNDGEIFRAAQRGDILGLLRQLALGANFNRHEDVTGMTALHYAAEADSLACVQFLLRNGAEPGALNSEGLAGFAMVPKESTSESMIFLLRPRTPGLGRQSVSDGGISRQSTSSSTRRRMMM